MDVLSKNQRLGRLQAALLLRDFASLSIINLNINIFNTNNIVTSLKHAKFHATQHILERPLFTPQQHRQQRHFSFLNLIPGF